MEEEYINFGDELVSKLDLLKAIGDYKAYSSTQPWSAARRGAFDSVIELALNRGILGTRKYTNPDTGESMYYATFGGDPFDINTYDKNTRRGWQDAAGFIGKLAESLPTKKSIEEKKKKEEEERIAKLPTFDSNSFLSTLYKNISDKEFGGQAFDGKTFDMNRWNTLDDVRDEKTGAVGTDKRKEALAKYLENIDRDFNAGEYNWENSPFKDADDFKSRLGEAVRALRSPELDDDTPALNKLGINYKDWFNNRTGEVYTTDKQGNPITYGTYYRGLLDLKDAKILAANAKAEAARKAYNANLIGGLRWYGKGLTGSPLSPENSNLDYLNLLAAKDSWNGDELSQLVGTFKLAQRNNALENLSKEELATFGRFGSDPNRFKKIRGLKGIYWDSLLNQIAKPYARGQLNSGVNFLDILDLNNPEKLKLKQLSTPRGNGIKLTDADKRDIYATLADLGAVIDPEVFTGTALALSASGARTWNNIEQKGLWDTLTDWKTWADWGTGALGGTMLLGDASSAVKFVRGLGKIMTIPMVWNSLTSMPEAKAAWDKIDLSSPIESAKKLTPQDYHALSTFLMGIVSGKNYLRGNLAERLVLKQSGINTESKSKIREYSNKFGITRTKPLDQKIVSTLKVKKTGEDRKVDEKVVELNEKQRTAIQKAKASEIEKVARDEGVEIPKGYKVEINKSKINNVRSYYLRPLGRANSEVIGKLTLTASRGEDKFETWLLDRSIWNKWKYGSNNNLRRIRENLGIKPIQQENSETPSTTPKIETTSETPKANKTSGNNEKNSEISKLSKERIQKYNEYVKNREEKLSRGEFSKNKLKSGSANIDGHLLQIVELSDGTFNLIYKGNIEGNYLKSQLKELLTRIRDIINNNRRNIKPNSPVKIGNTELGKILQDFKRKGWLKQGGTIDKQRIQQYKEFIKK